MNKILVTGGMGYIGSHTVVALMDYGFEVVIVDNLSNSNLKVLDGIERISGKKPAFYEIDLLEKQKLESIFRQEKDIHGIVHFAASKAVGESVENPLLYYGNNLISMINLLSLMKKYAVNNLVFSSSCTVYGQPDALPVTEETPFKRAESPYGNTKQICEEILKDVCQAENQIFGIALRYFNPVGAHQTGFIGELPLGIPNNLVPFITQTAAGIRSELKIYGKDYNTADGSAVRDYIHVVDLAKAHVLALTRMLEKKSTLNFEFYNVGTGKGLSVLEVVETFERVNNIPVKHRIVDRRPGDVECIYADTTKANKELGWKAELGVDEMMRSAWRWQQNLVAHPDWWT